MPRTTKPKLTEQQRFDRVLPHLTRARDQTAAALAAAHPAPGCLPIPALELPTSPADVHAACKAVFANLWTPSGNSRHPAWITARTGCAHMSEDQVLNAFDVVADWYSLLGGAHYYVNNIASLAKSGLQDVEQQEHLRHRLANLATGHRPRF
ncbi:hypothetical protein [Microtetraspora malaysiensis]|uniref:Uncharacterized protein n=1 Tax=Microtetraspora malaysiensis TaxID=161358 RepID=A0ABW6SN37_9ACTN